jgi:hypothetical protein
MAMICSLLTVSNTFFLNIGHAAHDASIASKMVTPKPGTNELLVP